MKSINTPYNTGKVKIGLAYNPTKLIIPTEDESRLQKALLGSFDNSAEVALKRYIGIVLFAVLFTLVVAYAHR